jgi:hypothetical protein
VGQLRNVSIHHVVGVDIGNFGCVISGLPGHPIENLSLSDIHLELAGGHTHSPNPETVPEKERDYPEATMFGPAPAWGLFFRHVRGLRLHNLNLSTRKPDARPDIVRWDVS